MAHPIFEQNPHLDVVYKTADKMLFYTENSANNHARTLENKKVVKLTRKSTPTKAKAKDSEPAKK